MNEQLPPQSVEAEQSLIGSMFLDSRCIDDVASLVLVTDFYRQDHQEIYKTILDLSQKNQAVDVVTVSESMGEGIAYLSSITKNTPTHKNAMSYANIIRKQAKARSLIQVCGEAIGGAYQGESPDHLANRLGNALDSIETVSNETAADMGEIVVLAMNELEVRHKSKSDLIGFSTGLRDLDKATGGLTSGSLVVVGGRPSMGKTAFALQIIDKHLSVGGVGLFFSMEMDKIELFNRQWAAQARVSLQKIRQPKTLQDFEWHKLTPAAGVLKDYKLRVDDQAGLHLNQIRARARAYKRKQGSLDFIVVDYLTLMNLGEGSDRVNQVGEVTKGLKNLARDLGTCVILLSQLNRGLEQRPNKRPVMSDLRDSGAIEQDADVIAFLYRDEVYNPDTEQKGICEVILAKQRNAPTQTVRTAFLGEFQTFEDMAYGQFNRP